MARPNYKSPNEKLDIAGRGHQRPRRRRSGRGFRGKYRRLVRRGQQQPGRRAEKDTPGARRTGYRVMLEKEKSIDAVVRWLRPTIIMRPPPSGPFARESTFMCEKPLTHTVWEARQLTLAARQEGVATQMGNQGHSGDGIRELCEMVWSGAIGPVREAHCWTDRAKGWWPQGHLRPPGSDPVPAIFGLGQMAWSRPGASFPARRCPKNQQTGSSKNVYHPSSWRGWWDFGCGALGDMACHLMDCPQMALKLGPPIRWKWFPRLSACRKCRPCSPSCATNFPLAGRCPPAR